MITQVDDRVQDGQDEREEAERGEGANASARTARSASLQMSALNRPQRGGHEDALYRKNETENSEAGGGGGSHLRTEIVHSTG